MTGEAFSYDVRLSPGFRELLRSLLAQLRELVGSDDPGVVRLFPPAYSNDDAASEEYRRLVHDDLVTRRRAAIDVMDNTLGEETLDAEQLAAWLSALHDLRLVLGTRLGITEDGELDDLELDDPDEPAAARYSLYRALAALEEDMVDALSGLLPEEGTG